MRTSPDCHSANESIMTDKPIVLIDDDRPWAQATADLLRHEGFEVQTAEDGERGLQLLDEIHPLLVILDVNLPRLGGLELLHELRQHYLDLPVLMVSSDDSSSVIAQAMGEGASGFLRKPLPSGLLLRAIRRLITTPASDEGSAGPIE
ncbi:MAG: response regulator [Planctomycetes bacterium]|nr:response regulator [Planctomycetota bacterium]